MIKNTDMGKYVKERFREYTKEVIKNRAIPDMRDGLKPVQRRILFAMKDMGVTFSSPTRKSARIVGDVIGKYHPHGDMAVYDAMVNMAKDFSNILPMIIGQGNFGSPDGDAPAAMRYTEVKLSRHASEWIRPVDEDAVDTVPTYDMGGKEPAVLPLPLPLALVNGTSGIAVVISTEIPPHSPKELAKAAAGFIRRREGWKDNIKGPDFPSGCSVYPEKGDLYGEGKGSYILAARYTVKDGEIRFTDLPPGVSASKVVEELANLEEREELDENVTGYGNASGKRQEVVVRTRLSEKKNVRIAEELLRMTSMVKRVSFSMNFVKGDEIIESAPIDRIVSEIVEFRRDVTKRVYSYRVERLEAEISSLVAEMKAIENLETVIEAVKSARNREEAAENVRKALGVEKETADKIVSFRLYKLSSQEVEKVRERLSEAQKEKRYYEEGLSDPAVMDERIAEEYDRLAEEMPERRSPVFAERFPKETYKKPVAFYVKGDKVWVEDISPEDFASRGGKGRNRSEIPDHTVFTDTHSVVLLTFGDGTVKGIRVKDVSEKPKHIANYVSYGEGDEVLGAMAWRPDAEWFLMGFRSGKILKRPAASVLPRSLFYGKKLFSPEETPIPNGTYFASGDAFVVGGGKNRAVRRRVAEIRTVESSSESSGVYLFNGEMEFFAAVEPSEKVLFVSKSATAYVIEPVKIREKKKGKSSGVKIFGEGTCAVAAPRKSHGIAFTRKGKRALINLDGIPEREHRGGRGVNLLKLDEGDEIASLSVFSIDENTEREVEK